MAVCHTYVVLALLACLCDFASAASWEKRSFLSAPAAASNAADTSDDGEESAEAVVRAAEAAVANDEATVSPAPPASPPQAAAAAVDDEDDTDDSDASEDKSAQPAAKPAATRVVAPAAKPTTFQSALSKASHVVSSDRTHEGAGKHSHDDSRDDEDDDEEEEDDDGDSDEDDHAAAKTPARKASTKKTHMYGKNRVDSETGIVEHDDEHMPATVYAAERELQETVERQQELSHEETELQNVEDFHNRVDEDAQQVAKETESSALADTLGIMRKEMRQFATPFYLEHIANEREKLASREKKLKETLDHSNQ